MLQGIHAARDTCCGEEIPTLQLILYVHLLHIFLLRLLMGHARKTVGLREIILLFNGLDCLHDISYIISISNHVYDGRTMQPCDLCTISKHECPDTSLCLHSKFW